MSFIDVFILLAAISAGPGNCLGAHVRWLTLWGAETDVGMEEFIVASEYADSEQQICGQRRR